jgi:hypothetical protein
MTSSFVLMLCFPVYYAIARVSDWPLEVPYGYCKVFGFIYNLYGE